MRMPVVVERVWAWLCSAGCSSVCPISSEKKSVICLWDSLSLALPNRVSLYLCNSSRYSPRQCLKFILFCPGTGFGFLVDDQGNMIKKPQMLQVNVGDNVEIGANSCIDRGSWRNTVIGDHTKIDNQVQIGHNVIIGRSCMICGQVGLGGSSTIGDFVVLGGKCGVADHISIASKVRIAAKSGVTRNITQPGDYAGFPAVPAAEWRRSMARFCKLGQAKLILD
ncbi:hypothetical protein L7F22_046300 [Adiantum nelumboides]|nr:hypothetical protein [Adiantum nelumboides]